MNARIHIAEYIKTAIASNTVQLQYQPQYCLVANCFEMSGVEALLRTGTNQFHTEKLISVAIETNQIIDLGYCVLKAAARQLRKWADENLITSGFNMSINIAAEQLRDEDFCAKVRTIIANAEIYPSQVTLELTESSMIDDADIAKIYQLSAAGFTLSIDDFGTGYSSLGRLKLLPVQEIKIDKTFVDDITKTKQDIALITAMFQLTQALDKFTIVEGVENARQYKILQDIGFTCFQGYFFGVPESAEEIEENLRLIDSLHYRPCQM